MTPHYGLNKHTSFFVIVIIVLITCYHYQSSSFGLTVSNIGRSIVWRIVGFAIFVFKLFFKLPYDVDVALYLIYLLDKEQISLTLFTADQIFRLTNGEFNSLNLSRELEGDNILEGCKINIFIWEYISTEQIPQHLNMKKMQQ